MLLISSLPGLIWVIHRVSSPPCHLPSLSTTVLKPASALGTLMVLFLPLLLFSSFLVVVVLLLFMYLFIWLRRVLVAACMWDLVP